MAEEDIAGYVVLHAPGFSEYLQAVFESLLKMYEPHGSNFRRRAAVGIDRFEPSKERKAREILSLIEAEEADIEALMQGAQLCYDLFG